MTTGGTAVLLPWCNQGVPERRAWLCLLRDPQRGYNPVK